MCQLAGWMELICKQVMRPQLHIYVVKDVKPYMC